MRAFLFKQNGDICWVDLKQSPSNFGVNGVSYLPDMWKYLDCRCIDMMVLEEDSEHSIDLVFDDEFIIAEKEPNKVWLSNYLNGITLCGHVLMVKHDGEGDLAELTDEDLARMISEFSLQLGVGCSAG